MSRLGLESHRKVLDLRDRVRCRGCGARGRAVVSIKVGKVGGVILFLFTSFSPNAARRRDANMFRPDVG